MLHHLDPEPSLRRAGELLRPGGRLLVIGLAGIGEPLDVAVDLASAALNPLVGLVKHPRAVRIPPPPDPMPMRDPDHTFGELRELAGRVLPGARLRRRLFFRYTLAWTKPAVG
ncbi:MAG: hypothetical protein R2734_11085 [Nocardioides sp.]